MADDPRLGPWPVAAPDVPARDVRLLRLAEAKRRFREARSGVAAVAPYGRAVLVVWGVGTALALGGTVVLGLLLARHLVPDPATVAATFLGIVGFFLGVAYLAELRRRLDGPARAVRRNAGRFVHHRDLAPADRDAVASALEPLLRFEDAPLLDDPAPSAVGGTRALRAASWELASRARLLTRLRAVVGTEPDDALPALAEVLQPVTGLLERAERGLAADTARLAEAARLFGVAEDAEQAERQLRTIWDSGAEVAELIGDLGRDRPRFDDSDLRARAATLRQARDAALRRATALLTDLQHPARPS